MSSSNADEVTAARRQPTLACRRHRRLHRAVFTRPHPVLSASPPALIAAGLGLLAALQGEGRIIGVPFGAAAEVRGGVVGVERRALPESFRQIGIREELATEGNEVGPALLQPLLGAGVIEP